MTALGSYLREMREQRKLKPADVAEALGMSDVSVWRIETGKQEPGGPLLIRYVDLVRGSYDDVRRLVADDDATAIDGEALARARLHLRDSKELAELREKLGDDEIALRAARIAADPSLLEAISRLADVTRSSDHRAREGDEERTGFGGLLGLI